MRRAPKEDSVVAHLLAIIPDSYVDALAKGDLLQVLLIAILTGFAVSRMGTVGERVAGAIAAAARSSSASSGSSSGWRRSARSGPWPSPSAPTGLGSLV